MPIRAAEPDDVPELLPLFEQWGHELAADAVRRVLSDWAETADSDVLVAEVDGHVAGMAAVSAAPLLSEPGRYARLAGLVVAASHRRDGVGAALLEAAEERARSWGCERLELTSSWSRSAAHAFYPARGYEETSHHHARYQRKL